ncbi:hypothetical protein CbuRSA461_01235 [Coxiella burnetii]|nr:hypothetical protein CbuRSA461_01235 [Coxiella burnetii]
MVWVVGNRQKFNREGVVPVNRTTRNLMYAHTENDWTYLPLIKALVAIAALLQIGEKPVSFFKKS